jgi:hypothetical protein
MFIVRSGVPSKYDECAYGSVCKSVKPLRDEFDIYVQMSHDDNSPRWEKVGTFSPKTYELVIQEVTKILNIKQVK